MLNQEKGTKKPRLEKDVSEESPYESEEEEEEEEEEQDSDEVRGAGGQV